MIDIVKPEGCNSFWPYFILFPFSLWVIITHVLICPWHSMLISYCFQALTLSFSILHAIMESLLFLFLYFLAQHDFFFCPTSVGLPLPDVISVPIKVCVKLAAWRAQQEGWSCYDSGRIVTTVKALTLLSAHFEEILTRTSVIQMSPLAYLAPRWFIKYWKLLSQQIY